MISKDLKQSLTDLQVAALERLARRDGIAINREQLVRLIERGGIGKAFEELRRSQAMPELQVSIFKRFAQRWFGRA